MQNTCFSCSIFINANLYVPFNYCKFAGDFGSNDDSGDFEEFKQDCMSNNVLPMYYIREELENMLEDRRYDLNFQIRY